MNGLADFHAAMRAAGLDYGGPLLADGKLHRIKVEGDRERNSWYVLHDGSPAAGAFGCWKRGFKETWCDRTQQLSQTDWDRVRERWQETDRQREEADANRQAKARKTADWILARAQSATAHTYLTAKGVQPHGDLRVYHTALVLPLHDSAGAVHSLQFIREDGSKRFLTGGRIAGCFFTIGDQQDGPLVICEGYATGASIHAATGFMVVCATHAGNLKAVAESFRRNLPARPIIVAADNDQFTAGNPGLTKATATALAINAKLAVPQFSDLSSKPTDFNDLHQLAGLAEVVSQIEAASAIAPPVPVPVVDLHTAPRIRVSKPGVVLPEAEDATDQPASFPTDALPPDMALMICGVARAMRVPESLPGMMALALVAASIGKGLELDRRPGKPPTPGNLFVVPTAESGSGKTECYKLLAAVFLAFERAMQERWRKEMLPTLEGDLRFAEGQLKKLDRKLAKDSTTQEEAEHCRAQQTFHIAHKKTLEAQLHEPQLSIQDATVEKAAAVMHHNDEVTFSTSSDARKLVDNLLGRYSANKKLADDGIYLAAYSGDDVKDDRLGRDGVRLANPCMTLLWALQPDALQMLLDEDSLQQGGWLARCLIAHTRAQPQHIGGDACGISDKTRAGWETLILSLLVTYRQPPILPASEPADMDMPL